MSEPPKLSDADREKMTAFGWDADNPKTVAKYQELTAERDTGRINQRELNRDMNRFALEQHINESMGRGQGQGLERKPDDIER